MKETVLQFLHELKAVQDQMAEVLLKKQAILVRPDKEQLDRISDEENEILEQLTRMQKKREEILDIANRRDGPFESIQEFCEAHFPHHLEIKRLLDASQQQSRQIRYLALTNLTMTQRSIIHLSQVLEIIETRGQGKATYRISGGNEGNAAPGGGFVDRVA